jgi:uncharacterized protein
MSQPAKQQEPTMEEILASIRRIIAEDDLRPPPPPPASVVKPAPAEAATLPATVEHAPREAMADGFDDPDMSSAAANDVFEPRESPWRPGEDIAAAEETREPAAPDIDPDAGKPVASLEAPRFAAPVEPAPPEPAREMPAREMPARELLSREPARAPRLEPFGSEVAKAESARSEFVRAEAAKSDLARPEHERPHVGKPELPKFEWPRREARWEAPRPEFRVSTRSEPARPEPAGPESTRPELARPEPARPESTKPEPARAPAAASHPVLRGAGEEGLLSPRATAAVDIAFNTLAQSALVQNSRTMEDLVREMLKPMLKVWLDDNLPSLVERLVRAEIERVSRGRS